MISDVEQRQVLVLNQYAVPRSQGGGTRHVDLFGRLTGWEPTIVATSRNHATQASYKSDDPRFRLVWTPAYSSNGVRRIAGWAIYAGRALVIGLCQKDLDVIYASSPQLFAVAAGYAIARVRRRPLIMEVRDLWPESIVEANAMRRGSVPHRFLQRLERFLYHHAVRIVVVTEGWEEHFASLGISAADLDVLPNGTEPDDFEVAEDRVSLRKRWGIDGFTAVFAGSHGPKDGLAELVAAAQSLPEVRFLLVGAGSAKALTQQFVADNSLANVEFREPVPKSELPGLLQACDVGVHCVTPLPVFDKGMSPNKLFDYMAAGLPIVSNAARPLSRVIRDDECGRLAGPGGLARCLQEVMNAAPSDRARWSARGRSILRERYSRTTMAKRLQALLDEALDGTPTGTYSEGSRA